MRISPSTSSLHHHHHASTSSASTSHSLASSSSSSAMHNKDNRASPSAAATTPNIQVANLLPERQRKRRALSIKLTDECLAAINEAIKNEWRIRMTVQKGQIMIHVGNGTATPTIFQCSQQNLPGSVDAICHESGSNQSSSYQTVSALDTKLVVNATEKTFAETREKAQKLAEEESKKKAKDVAVKKDPIGNKFNRAGGKQYNSQMFRPAVAAAHFKPAGTTTLLNQKRISPPLSHSSTSSQATSSPLNPSSKSSHQSSAPSKPTQIPIQNRHELLKKSTRERCVHLLVTQKYKNVNELLERLRYEGAPKNVEMEDFLAGAEKIVKELSEFDSSTESLSLLPSFHKEVNLRWPWFLSSEREHLRRLIVPSHSTNQNEESTSIAPSRRSGVAAPQAPLNVAAKKEDEAKKAKIEESPKLLPIGHENKDKPIDILFEDDAMDWEGVGDEEGDVKKNEDLFKMDWQPSPVVKREEKKPTELLAKKDDKKSTEPMKHKEEKKSIDTLKHKDDKKSTEPSKHKDERVSLVKKDDKKSIDSLKHRDEKKSTDLLKHKDDKKSTDPLKHKDNSSKSSKIDSKPTEPSKHKDHSLKSLKTDSKPAEPSKHKSDSKSSKHSTESTEPFKHKSSSKNLMKPKSSIDNLFDVDEEPKKLDKLSTKPPKHMDKRPDVKPTEPSKHKDKSSKPESKSTEPLKHKETPKSFKSNNKLDDKKQLMDHHNNKLATKPSIKSDKIAAYTSEYKKFVSESSKPESKPTEPLKHKDKSKNLNLDKKLVEKMSQQTPTIKINNGSAKSTPNNLSVPIKVEKPKCSPLISTPSSVASTDSFVSRKRQKSPASSIRTASPLDLKRPRVNNHTDYLFDDQVEKRVDSRQDMVMMNGRRQSNASEKAALLKNRPESRQDDLMMNGRRQSNASEKAALLKNRPESRQDDLMMNGRRQSNASEKASLLKNRPESRLSNVSEKSGILKNHSDSRKELPRDRPEDQPIMNGRRQSNASEKAPPSKSISFKAWQMSRELETKFPPVRDSKQALKYHEMFETDYPQYRKCHDELTRVSKKFHNLKLQFDRSVPDSKEQNELLDQIQLTYERYQKDQKFAETRKQHEQLHARLSLLKKRVADYEQHLLGQQNGNKSTTSSSTNDYLSPMMERNAPRHVPRYHREKSASPGGSTTYSSNSAASTTSVESVHHNLDEMAY